MKYVILSPYKDIMCHFGVFFFQNFSLKLMVQDLKKWK